MKRESSIPIVVYAAVLLLMFAILPAAIRMKPHPLTTAFAMMTERPAGNDTIVDPTRPHAEVPWNYITSYADTDSTRDFPATETPAYIGISNVNTAAEAVPSASPHGTTSAMSTTGSASTAPLSSAAPAVKTISVHSAVYSSGSSTKPAAKFRPLPVLNYHSVSIDPGNIVVISPDRFREQMQYLHDNEYRTLTMKEFIDIFEDKEEAPEKPILLTFDDGYTDNYETAMPILKEFGFHATLFMSPGMAGQKGYMDWDQIQVLKDNGWDIQPHGMTHPSLPKLSAKDQLYEITEARRLIEEKLNVTADIYCYPYGQYNQETLHILSDNGFRYAFTIEQGKTTAGQQPYKLPRIFVNGEEKLSALVHKLTKW